jgi:hypothetical protein
LSGAGVLTPFVLPEGSAASNFSAFLAMLVLVVGIVEAASEFGTRAAMLFANAEDLNAFQSHLGGFIAASSITLQDFDKFDAEYQGIKKASHYNHEPADLDRFKLQHGSSPEFAKTNGDPAFSFFAALWVRAAYELQSIWWLMLLWIMAASGFVVALKFASPPLFTP